MNEKFEMASLTKTTTFCVAVKLMKQFSINLDEQIVYISRSAAYINGTHSGLREGDQILLKDLFYGMMLPSGNDAALAIAQFFGAIIINNSKKNSSASSPTQEFVKEMNKYAIKNGIKETAFANPHGLSEKGNRSTVTDLGKIGFLAMQDPLIASVVSAKIHTAQVLDRRNNLRQMTWSNTNKMLDEEGFLGLKTGNTPNAGPCLSLCYNKGEECFIVTLLNCKSPEHRWTEATRLISWSSNKMQSVRSYFRLRNATSSTKLRARIAAGLSKF